VGLHGRFTGERGFCSLEKFLCGRSGKGINVWPGGRRTDRVDDSTTGMNFASFAYIKAGGGIQINVLLNIINVKSNV